jgi:hypothetical protein
MGGILKMRPSRPDDRKLNMDPRSDRRPEREHDALGAFLDLYLDDLARRLAAIRNVLVQNPANKELLATVDAVKEKLDAFELQAALQIVRRIPDPSHTPTGLQ